VEFIQWTEKYSVGDPLMDAYHHVFFQTIKDLAEALDTLPPEIVADRIDFLMSYAGMHFESEERLMEEHAFPGVEAHRSAHQAFKEQLAFIQENYRANPSPQIAEQLLAMSEDWLTKHILGEDMKYKPYLKR
jgi:hemerythrin